MIQVYFHLVVADLQNLCHELVTVFVLQRNDSPLMYIIRIKAAVDAEDVFVKFQYAFFHVFAIRLVAREREVELAVFCHVDDRFFKSVERDAETADKQERLVVGSLFNELCLVVIGCVQLISHSHVLVGLVVHFLAFYCFVFYCFVGYKVKHFIS